MENLNKIMEMSDRQIQDLLRKISIEGDSNTLSIALLGINYDIKECIFRNLSTHARSAIEKSFNEFKKKQNSRFRDTNEYSINSKFNLKGQLLWIFLKP